MTRMFSRAGKIPGPTSLPNTKDRLERLVRQLRRGGFLPGDAQPLTEMANVVDERLIRAIMTDPSRVLTQLLLKPKHTGYYMHQQAHGYELLAKDEHNFIPRMLHKAFIAKNEEQHGPLIGRLDHLTMLFFLLDYNIVYNLY